MGIRNCLHWVGVVGSTTHWDYLVVVEVVEVVVILSPPLEVGVVALLPELVRCRLPSHCLGWRWLAIGAVALSIVWPLLGHFFTIFARVLLLPFLDILT